MPVNSTLARQRAIQSSNSEGVANELMKRSRGRPLKLDRSDATLVGADRVSSGMMPPAVADFSVLKRRAWPASLVVKASAEINETSSTRGLTSDCETDKPKPTPSTTKACAAKERVSALFFPKLASQRGVKEKRGCLIGSERVSHPVAISRGGSLLASESRGSASPGNFNGFADQGHHQAIIDLYSRQTPMRLKPPGRVFY